MFSDEQLIEAVESSIFLPTLPGRFEALNIPGVRGRFGPGVQGGFINRVGATRLTSEQAPKVIKAVREHFEALNLSFGWFVVSSDTPDDLQEHLQQAGFEQVVTAAGMVHTDLDREFPTRPGVTVRPASSEERHLVSHVYETGFPIDKTASDLFADMIETPSMVHYLVYLENVSEPVGATSMFYEQSHNAVVLELSVILEEYRGQGIYKNLIAQRIHDARRDGIKLAVVQAIEATSAPALRRHGFVKKSVIQLWWIPQET